MDRRPMTKLQGVETPRPAAQQPSPESNQWTRHHPSHTINHYKMKTNYKGQQVPRSIGDFLWILDQNRPGTITPQNWPAL
jgi:hypothetical protein